MSPKPVYLALKQLIKTQWWTGPLTLRTDAAGKLAFRGFLGDYALAAPGGRAVFRLDRPGTASLSVRVLPLPKPPGGPGPR